jgi:hypothetical protein
MTEKNAIDPTAVGGLPLSWVKTAEWVEQEEVIVVAGLERRIPRRKRLVNGIIFDEATPPNVWKEVLKHYPQVPVMIPENDDERERRIASGKFRAAENIVWQGVEYHMPKGIPVMVPEPIAEMVNHLNEIYRSKEVMDAMNQLIERGSPIT